MIYLVSDISVAQVATAINAAITFVQITISFSLIILLIHFMPKTNTAITWSFISKALHSSLWPTILNADSSSNEISGVVVSTVSHLTLVTTALVAIAGILLPLGLGNGPLIPTDLHQASAEYLPDNSPLGYSTTRNRPQFVYGRLCRPSVDSGAIFWGCPGNVNTNTSVIATYLVDKFNSTPHGPFAMQYRWFYTFSGAGDNRSRPPEISVLQTFILRSDIFIVEGLVVDMSSTHPGIGFWNQTLPKLPNGGMWSQDLLWLEPVTRCINTNLTLDYYTQGNNNNDGLDYVDLNITDYGGFANLTHKNPAPNRNGQHVDLMQYAYMGAVLSNEHAMLALNTTRQSSFIGASYSLVPTGDYGSNIDHGSSTADGMTHSLPISYFDYFSQARNEVLCREYGRNDEADGKDVNVECGILLGPPQRTDSGDPQDYGPGSRWSQKIHSCASATRASIQTVSFSTNGTTNLQSLNVTRMTLSGLNVLWAMEKTNMTVDEIDILWGRVDDRYENDSSLRTIRAEGFYLPRSSYESPLPPGFPPAGHVAIWDQVYLSPDLGHISVADYSGSSDVALASKFQSLVGEEPENGNAQIRNLIWTDMMTNNFIGTQTNNTLWVAEYRKSIQYDLRFATPGFVLLLIWAPSFLGATFLLITRSLTFEYMKKVLNHTSVGRIVVGASDLRIRGRDDDQLSFVCLDSDSFFVDLGDDPGGPGRSREKDGWGLSMPVTLDLDHTGGGHEDRDNVLEPLNQD
ncbi:hypothetical protein P691DRAFT_684747 [Macrolepiota fuliginosa MF-IS2]|uniref:Uncharacterized protein n=1 Tax=Macrolepiota fuliginosa MF-IS2 TaxID=1400762 RepID=A0A9P5X0R0_9AGAR|nr:hypothetical protein P691DRAFT_684747 [Macrolepiota fuliginosa MF-IS2]